MVVLPRPTARARLRVLQCVASGGTVRCVRSTTARTWSGPTVGGRPERGRSRSKPSTPSATNRSCHRHTARLDLPIWRTIAIVPTPAADRSTIRARPTYFSFIIGAATMASKRARASAVTIIFASFVTPAIWAAQPRIGTLLHGQDTSVPTLTLDTDDSLKGIASL